MDSQQQHRSKLENGRFRPDVKPTGGPGRTMECPAILDVQGESEGAVRSFFNSPWCSED
jgi:hypothetical protein